MLFNLGGNYVNPSLSVSFIVFTMMYILLPMIFNNQMNWVVLVFFIIILIIDVVVNLMNKCASLAGIFVGSITGSILGSAWYTLVKNLGNNELLYFNEFISNNVVCSRPKKQTFKCTVYKNGEIISSNIV